MPREGEGTGEKEAPEKQVKALIIKNTSVAGMMLHRNTEHMLPLSLAKSLRDQGLAVPIKAARPSHPAPPPPPPPDFEEEDEADEEKEESTEKADSEKPKAASSSARSPRQKEGGE